MTLDLPSIRSHAKEIDQRKQKDNPLQEYGLDQVVVVKRRYIDESLSSPLDLEGATKKARYIPKSISSNVKGKLDSILIEQRSEEELRFNGKLPLKRPKRNL